MTAPHDDGILDNSSLTLTDGGIADNKPLTLNDDIVQVTPDEYAKRIEKNNQEADMHFPPWTAEETPVTSSFIRARVCFNGCSVIIIEHKLESQGYSIEWQIIANQDKVAGYDCIRGYADSIEAAKEAAKAMLERINLLHRKDLSVQKDESVRKNKAGQLVILPKYDFNSKLYLVEYKEVGGWTVRDWMVITVSAVTATPDGAVQYWDATKSQYYPERNLFPTLEEAQAECDERNKC